MWWRRSWVFLLSWYAGGWVNARLIDQFYFTGTHPITARRRLTQLDLDKFKLTGEWLLKKGYV
jgi:hypothetical protein